jgi:hypothetical protein
MPCMLVARHGNASQLCTHLVSSGIPLAYAIEVGIYPARLLSRS